MTAAASMNKSNNLENSNNNYNNKMVNIHSSSSTSSTSSTTTSITNTSHNTSTASSSKQNFSLTFQHHHSLHPTTNVINPQNNNSNHNNNNSNNNNNNNNSNNNSSSTSSKTHLLHQTSGGFTSQQWTVYSVEPPSPSQSEEKDSPASRIAIQNLINPEEELLNVHMVDITHLLHLPQTVAASKLGIAQSTLSRRYKRATGNSWPNREIAKINREIDELVRTFANSEDDSVKQQIIDLRIRKARIIFPLKIQL